MVSLKNQWSLNNRDDENFLLNIQYLPIWVEKYTIITRQLYIMITVLSCKSILVFLWWTSITFCLTNAKTYKICVTNAHIIMFWNLAFCYSFIFKMYLVEQLKFIKQKHIRTFPIMAHKCQSNIICNFRYNTSPIYFNWGKE